MNIQKEKKKLRIPEKPFQLNEETIKEYNDLIKTEDMNNGAHQSSIQNKKILKVNGNSFQPSPEVIEDFYNSFINQLNLNDQDQSYPIRKKNKKKNRHSQFKKFFDHFQTEYELQQFEEKQNNSIEIKDLINTSQIQIKHSSYAKQDNQLQKQIQERNKKIDINAQQCKPKRKPLRNPFKKDDIQLVIPQQDQNNESKLEFWQSSPHKQIGSQKFQDVETVFPSKLMFSQFSPIREPNDYTKQFNMHKGKSKVEARDQSSITEVEHQVQSWTICQGNSCQILLKNEYENLFQSLGKETFTFTELFNICLNLVNRKVIPPTLNTNKIQQLTKFQVEFIKLQLYQWGMIHLKLQNLRNDPIKQNYYLIVKLIHVLSDRNICSIIDQGCLSELNVFLQTEYVYAAFIILVIEMNPFNSTIIVILNLINTLIKIIDNIRQAYDNQLVKYNEMIKIGIIPQNQQQIHKDLCQAIQNLGTQSSLVFDMYECFRKTQKLQDRIKIGKDFEQNLSTIACQHDEIVNELSKTQKQNKPQDQSDEQKTYIKNFWKKIQNQLLQFIQYQIHNQVLNREQILWAELIKQMEIGKQKQFLEKYGSQDSQNIKLDKNEDQNSLILKVIQIDMDSIDKVERKQDQKVAINQNTQNANQNLKEQVQNQKKQVKGQNEIKTQKQRTDEAKQKKWDNIMRQKELEEQAKQAKLDKKLKKSEILQSNLKQDAEKQDDLKQEKQQNICDKLQGIDQQKEQEINLQQNVPQQLSKRQQKKLARQKAELEKQLKEQQEKEQFEKERQPQPYTCDKMQDILKNTKYDDDAFNSLQWTKLLERKPIVQIIQNQKLKNYKNQQVQSKQKYRFKDILRKKSQYEQVIKCQYGQLRIIRYEYTLTEVFKLQEFKASMKWYPNYITNLAPETVQTQEITLFLNKIHPSNMQNSFQEILKYISQKQYQLGYFVELLMRRMIHDSRFQDQYMLLALQLKDQIKLKDQQQTIILNKSYILLLQQTLNKQFETFLNQENLLPYFENYIKIVESFWDAEIISEQYISELLQQILLRIEQVCKEYLIIMLVKLLNRVFNKYKKFVDHFYFEVHPQAIQLESKISLITLKEIIDKMMKSIPIQRVSSRCQILVENLYEYYSGNLKCMIAEDIQFYRSHKENQKEKAAQIQQSRQQICDEEQCGEIQNKVGDSFQLDYEEQFYALDELLVSNQSYVSQTQIFKELFYQIFQKGRDEIKNSLIIYKLVIHRKTLLLSVQKGSYQALEILKNQELYSPQYLYDIWKGILKPFLDKLQSYELSHVCLLIDPSNAEQDYYFKNLTLDLIMDFTKNGRRNPQEKIKILLDYKDQYASNKQLFDMTESFYMTGKVILEDDFLLQAKLFQRILISIFYGQFIKPSQLSDLIRNRQNFLIGAFKLGSEWAFDYIVRQRIEEFAEILYELLYNLAVNELFEIVSIIGLDRKYDFILDRLIQNLPDQRRQLIACL